MSKRILMLVGLLSAAWVLPLCAQPEDGKLNVSIGGGLSIPLNPTANFAGVGGTFLGGGGYNINKHNAILGQFMWNGLPPSIPARAQLLGGDASINLYSLTANYQYRGDFGSTFGYYVIAGGGWYYRHAAISKTTSFPAPVVCSPYYDWYGYGCSDGFVDFTRGAAKGTSSAGVNGGVGFTVRVKDSRWKFFIESRYIYANSRTISSQVSPVTFGMMFQ
jgi:Outer membrane protein beta-barrel domain